LCLVLLFVLPLRSAPLTQSPPASGIVNANSNLRAGPGTNYAKVGYAPLGTPVQIVACNTGCSWYQLDSGKWIAAWLVDSDCDSSYPGVCIAPAPPDLDCSDIPYRNFQVVGTDPHGFDGDEDGIGCEGSGPTPTFTPTPTTPSPGVTPTLTPPPTPTKVCDPNYTGACIPLVSYDLNCKDVLPSKRFQSIGSDPHNFDGDNDGLACE
jgi:hypothetical protein